MVQIFSVSSWSWGFHKLPWSDSTVVFQFLKGSFFDLNRKFLYLIIVLPQTVIVSRKVRCCRCLTKTILINLFLFSSRYRCDNSRCILWSSVCDKVSDCSDGSDESPRACAAAQGSCSKSENFRCNNGKYLYITDLRWFSFCRFDHNGAKMTRYKFECSHWWKFICKKIIYKIWSPVWIL